MKRIALISVLFLSLGVLLSSCRHDELCYSHPHTGYITITYDWSCCPNAEPASVANWFYPYYSASEAIGDKETLLYDLAGNEGGTIKILANTYDVVSINSDTENIIHKESDNYDTYYVTSRTTQTLEPLAKLGVRSDDAPTADDSQRIAEQPEMLWRGSVDDVTVVKNDTGKVITVPMDSCVYTYHVMIDSVKNIKYVTGLSCTVSGLAGGCYPASGEITDERVTVPFEVTRYDEENYLEGSFRTFGVPEGEDVHILIVYAVLDDDSKWYAKFDVTDQVKSLPHGGEIVIHGLPIPEPINDEGGMIVNVDEWQTVTIPIQM